MIGMDRAATRRRIGMLALAAALAAAAALWPPRALAGPEQDAETQLDRAVEQALHEGGSWFTAEERAVIERKCGYAAGSWDGFEASFSNGVYRCTNGRRVDDAEMRALMARAGPRIERRVETAMERPEVRAAIERVAREAEAEALRELAARRDD